MNKSFLPLTLFLILGSIDAQTISGIARFDDVIERRKQATLKLSVFKYGQVEKKSKGFLDRAGEKRELESKLDQIYSNIEKQQIRIERERSKRILPNYPSTAFFIGPSGLILTAYHLLDGFIDDNDFSIELKTSKGEKIEFDILKCGDARKVDLCLLKAVDYNPQAYFPKTFREIGLGHSLYSIGHCKDEEYKVQKSIVGKKRSDIHESYVLPDENWAKYNRGVEIITHEGDQCIGSSGGPLFDSEGFLHGVLAIKYFPERDAEINTAVSSSEIKNFLERHTGGE